MELARLIVEGLAKEVGARVSDMEGRHGMKKRGVDTHQMAVLHEMLMALVVWLKGSSIGSRRLEEHRTGGLVMNAIQSVLAMTAVLGGFNSLEGGSKLRRETWRKAFASKLDQRKREQTFKQIDVQWSKLANHIKFRACDGPVNGSIHGGGYSGKYVTDSVTRRTSI